MKKLFLTILCFLCVSTVNAQERIKLVVSSGAGGIMHNYALKISPILSKALNKQVIIDIRPGAEGSIAAAHVSQIKDETVFLIGSPKYWKPEFNHIVSFNTVAYLGYTPSILISHKAKNINSFREFLELSKAKKMSYGLSSTNPARELIKEIVKKYGNPNNVVEITYKSPSQAIMDAIGGHIDFAVSVPENVLQHIEEQKVNAIAILIADNRGQFSFIKTLKQQNIAIDSEFKYYANIFLWSNLEAKAEDVDKAKKAMLEFMMSEESSSVRKDLYIYTEASKLNNPKRYLEEILLD